MKKTAITFVLLISAVAAWNILVAYVDKELSGREHKGVYQSCHKIWAARGLYNSHDERNSITSFRRAFEHGTQGGEVDFSYDVKMNRFIVSHGHPKKDADGNFIYPKKEGELLTLEHLFQAAGEGHYFWLDYKNLEHLSAEETRLAIARLLDITEENGLRERLYIEGSNPLKLSRYTQAGFKTILGVHPLPQSNPFASIVINAYKVAYSFTDITAVALGYGSIDDPVYGEDTEKSFGSIPIFLFHVPDNEALLQSLVRKNGVRVILVGRDKSIDRYSINSCKKP